MLDENWEKAGVDSLELFHAFKSLNQIFFFSALQKVGEVEECDHLA